VSDIKDQVEPRAIVADRPSESLLSIVRVGVHLSQVISDVSRQRWRCAYEVMHRTEKLRGGRGKKDRKKCGRMKRLEKVAERWGIGLSTLLMYAKIHAVFFTPDVVQTTLECESSLGLKFQNRLPQRFFAIAVYTTNPFAAIKIAVDKLGKNQDYTVKRFKEDVAHLRRRPRRDKQEKADKENILRIPLTAELDEALQDLSGMELFQGKTVEEIAAAVILRARLSSAIADTARAVAATSQEVGGQSNRRGGRKKSRKADADQQSLL